MGDGGAPIPVLVEGTPEIEQRLADAPMILTQQPGGNPTVFQQRDAADQRVLLGQERV
jgi:hypothetical protein